MKMVSYLVAFLVALGMALPLSGMAREGNEPTDTPKVSGSPRATIDEDLDDLDEDIEEEEAIETPEVSVPEDLEDDAEELTAEDEDITKIKVSKEQNRVEVTYRLRAKLFGFIDVPYELRARVDANKGTLQAKGPWWLLFAGDNAAEVQTALEADKSLITSKNQGLVLSRIISILKAIAVR